MDLLSLFLYNYFELHGTEQNGTKKQTNKLCWNRNDQTFTQSVFVEMILNNKNEVIACRLLPRDIGYEALFFCLANPWMSSLCLNIIIWNQTK